MIGFVIRLGIGFGIGFGTGFGIGFGFWLRLAVRVRFYR